MKRRRSFIVVARGQWALMLHVVCKCRSWAMVGVPSDIDVTFRIVEKIPRMYVCMYVLHTWKLFPHNWGGGLVDWVTGLAQSSKSREEK